MFVTLASLCIYYQLKEFSWIMRLDTIQDQLCEIAPSHNIRSLVQCSPGQFKSLISQKILQNTFKFNKHCEYFDYCVRHLS